MAAQPISTTRRALLGAAAALPLAALAGPTAAPIIATPRPIRGKQSGLDGDTWTRRLAHYRRLHACAKAEAETGEFRAANDRYNRIYEELTARFGSWPKACRSKIGKPLCAAAYARVAAAEDAYYRQHTKPVQKAARRLARTPAPNLDALRAKIEVMREQEFESSDGGASDPLEVVWQDVRRLMAAASEPPS
jgi:hypothetical protein